MGRHSCGYKQKLRKGLWSPEEDEKLLRHINKYGHGCWSSVPKQAGLQRCGKSCRLRWINYLRPDLKRGTFSQQEENLIIELHAVLGNRWSQIAAQLQGRTDNEIKNLWHSSIKKKLFRQRGIDPNTHKPLSEVDQGGGGGGCGREANKVPTNSDNKASGGSNEQLKPPAAATNPGNSNSALPEPAPPLIPAADDLYPSESSRVKNSTTTTEEFFQLDRLVHESSSSSGCRRPSDSVGCFPLRQLNYDDSEECGGNQTASPGLSSVNPNQFQLLSWLSHNCRAPFDNCNTEPTVVVVPSVSSTVLTAPTGLKSAINLPPDNPPPSCVGVNGVQFWEAAGAPSNSSGNSGSIDQLQSNDSFFDSDVFPWSDLQEDLKWSEYLHNAFPMSASIQSQSEGVHGEMIKVESQFPIGSGLSSTWHQNQQQQLQGSDMYGKGFIC